MKILIIYATTEGHTRKICSFLKENAENLLHEVEVIDARVNPPEPSNYHRVIIAGSVHMSKYQHSIQHYCQEYAHQLNDVPSAFLSVSLTVAGNEQKTREELERFTNEFFKKVNWSPALVDYVAGALLYTQYGFIKRWIMRLISKQSGGSTDISKDHIYTNWDQVRTFLEKVIYLRVPSTVNHT